MEPKGGIFWTLISIGHATPRMQNSLFNCFEYFKKKLLFVKQKRK